MRLPGWEERLDEVIAAFQGGGFVWGVRDCFRLPLAAAEAVAGLSLWADLRPYDSEFGAARLLLEHGFAGVGDALAAELPEVHPVRARRGDVGVVLDANGQESGVVVIGAQVVGVAEGHGLTVLPRSKLVRAFEVG